jgi:hypothetical protein
MRRRSLSRTGGVALVVVLVAAVLACTYIDRITGPTEVAPGSVVEYLLGLSSWGPRGTDLVPRGTTRAEWTCFLAVDVPQGWTFDSCDYEGEIGGVPIQGKGSIYEPPSPMGCEPSWPPVPTGFERLWVRSETHDTGSYGWATARVRFNVDGDPGQYILLFHTETHYGGGDPWCANTAFFTVNVSESLIFADNLELGTAAAWSAVVP